MPGSRPSRPKRSASLLAMALLLGGADLVPYRVDADRIDTSLTSQPGDPARGRTLMLDLHTSTCLLCHAGPFPEQRFQGTIGPSLTGIGDRLTPAQIRLRLVDATIVNPDTPMPRFYAVTGLTRVAPAYAGRPVLEANQIEDLVAFLSTLKTP